MDIDSEQQLQECFEKHIDSLYRFCLFRLHGDEMMANDLVQESFYRTGVELSKGKKILNLKSFVFRIALNLIIDLSRKKNIESLEEKEETEYITYAIHASPEKQVSAQIELERMYQILDNLPSDDKTLFLLRYVEELSPQEISAMLQQDTNALTVRLHRIKKKVSDMLYYPV